MTPSAGDTATVLILVSAVLIFFAFWAWRLRQGIRVRPWVVALFAVFYELLFLFALEEVLRLPWGRVAFGIALLDLVLFAAGVLPGFQYTFRTTRFERTASGQWLYRGRLAIPAAWLGLFLFRYGVELALLGRVYLLTPTPSQAVAIPTFAVALILVDALFAASTGLVMGDAVAIWWAFYSQHGRGGVPEGVRGPSTPPTGASVPSPTGENTD
ncbi:MAG TPA: hypothetical protein VKT21_01890 [Thermoplasmata archaeon]|nr:hypothetical protein [Thermoplasmata archaeon]